VTRVVVLADTHLRSGSTRTMPVAAMGHLRKADVILHAGDVLEPWVLDDLADLAPVHAVLGNNDHGVELPERRIVEIGGVAVGMVHDSGARTGREQRMRRWFPACDLVVFGHSHIPLDRFSAGQRLLNPGSPTDRRTQPHHTLALVDITDGRLTKTRIVELD
jgi:putative phosphoesterase